jgi:hypothetical protein
MTDSAQNIATTYDPTEIEKNGTKLGKSVAISSPLKKVSHFVS